MSETSGAMRCRLQTRTPGVSWRVFVGFYGGASGRAFFLVKVLLKTGRFCRSLAGVIQKGVGLRA